jgi:hypothetical protein
MQLQPMQELRVALVVLMIKWQLTLQLLLG